MGTAALEPQMTDGSSAQKEKASVPIYTEITPQGCLEFPDDNPVHCRPLDGSELEVRAERMGVSRVVLSGPCPHHFLGLHVLLCCLDEQAVATLIFASLPPGSISACRVREINAKVEEEVHLCQNLLSLSPKRAEVGWTLLPGLAA